MIRPMIPTDSAALIALSVAAGLFSVDETEALSKVLSDYFSGKLDDEHQWVVDDEQGELRGSAYYAPAPFSDGTWDLLMIAVRPDCQRQGRGAALLQYVETALGSSGQRLLLADTSGLPKYDRARAFYTKCGFEEEARIRDFYEAGDDKIVFRKALNAD